MWMTPGRFRWSFFALALMAVSVFLLFRVGLSPELDARQSRPYLRVSDERLRDPEPENWLMYRRTYNGWGFSPLDQITSRNVTDLSPVWVFQTGVFNEHHQAPPIVNDGTMFITTGSHVIALDAATGQLLWRYVRQLPENLVTRHPTNRGVALYEDKVFVGTLDAYVVALDAMSGAVIWEQPVEDYRRGYYVTMAPLVAEGKVIVGTSGGEQGIRGFVTALDVVTGEELWRTYTVPSPGEIGSETWPGETWRTGAGPVWLTGHYDPILKVSYWGTGNPGPWMGDRRSGDNLFTNSTVALDVDTGVLRGYHQYHWNGSWDWDEANPPLLIDIDRGGQTIPALIHAGRNGYLWFLSRSEDQLSFIEGKPFVHNNVFEGLDLQTGRPQYNDQHIPQTGQQVEFCPSVGGGKNWQPEAFSPVTRLLYIPANNNLCSSMEGRDVVYAPGRGYAGADFITYTRDDADHVGELQAWDVDSGERAWTRNFLSGNGGSILATGGNLLFLGGAGKSAFEAFDAVTGQPLWHLPTNTDRFGVPTSYSVDGVQYVAVQTGAQPLHTDTTHVTSRLSGPQDGLVWVFALDCQC